MKIKNIACTAALMLASLSATQASITLTAWNFDNVAIGAINNPSPSTGFGTASAFDGFNGSINFPDVQSLAGSSSGNANSWRIRGNPSSGNEGWSTNAPIGTQGALFTAGTAGYYKIKVSFDVYATTNAEAALQVQYTTDGHIWNNATITSVGTLGVIANNAITTDKLVVGSYVILTNNGTTGWNNQITVDLSGVSGVDNDPNFAVRMVNAATGTNCLDTTGATYNNTNGDWTFDNVVVQGTSIDTVADWTFERYKSGTTITNPLPDLGTGSAYSIGFDNNYTYAGSSTPGATNGADVTTQAGSSTPTAINIWRLRSAPGNNGWNTAAPIGTQGAQFLVSTVNYNDPILTFDIYFTTQGEAKMMVEYTTDGGTNWNIAQNLSYAANPTFIVTNTDSPNTVLGSYFYQTTGQNFYNNLVVDFTGVAGAANNPLFGVRIVNAATGFDDVAFNGGPYNNSSGNCRLDNVTIGGTFNGSIAPVLTNDLGATVDHTFTNTFPDSLNWRTNIGSIFVNGSLLTNTAYKVTAGQIVYTPSKSVLLQLAQVDSIVIFATNFSNAKVTQPIAAGVAVKLALTTPVAGPSASGGTLTSNPVFGITDQFGNGTATAPNTNIIVYAAVSGVGGWTLGGATNQPAVNGFASFTNLSATLNGISSITGASITFTVSNYNGAGNVTNINSSLFNIGALTTPFTRGNLAVLQLDTSANNSTMSIIEVKPSVVNQTNPVSITPISATGTNALRMASAGSCGKLSLSADGTLITFAAFADGNASTPDETFILNRAVGTLNYTNGFTCPVNYVSDSLGGSQARSAATLDNRNYVIDDKGFLDFAGADVSPNPFDLLNNVVVRAFGNRIYVETQKTSGLSPIPTIYGLDLSDLNNPAFDVSIGTGLGNDQIADDFYMISTNGGSTFDVLYVLDGASSTLGAINKFSFVNGSWVSSGSFTNGNGGDCLFATTNDNNGVDLYYTTGTGGTAGNQIVRVVDSSSWNAPINITASNVIYTASGNTSVEGLTFVPQQTANTTQLIPPPLLFAASGITVGAPFTVTLGADDAAWRAAITSVTVNGVTLSASAYTNTLAGMIGFAGLGHTIGQNSITISATGFSTASVIQSISSSQPIVNGVRELTTHKLTFNFTNAPGLGYSVLSTNKINAPLSTWPVVGTTVETPAGPFSVYGFTNTPLSTNAAQFFILRQQ